MDNRLFALLILLFIVPFAGWLVYDWRQDALSIRTSGLSRDVLADPRNNAIVPLEYRFHFAEPAYSHVFSTAQIEAIARKGDYGEHYHIYGLTQADFSLATQFEVGWSKAWFKDEYRVWVEDLRVEFEYNTLNVYVTNAYPEASCEYRTTLDHENQHVAIHRALHEKYEGIFRDKIGNSLEIPLESRPVTAASFEAGKARVAEIISQVTDPLFQGFRDELEAEQAKLDTPENYAALKAQCQHW
ncbi:MAG TPA: hypothetical protein VHE12_10115 [bacterium]|nr:hypothetical protein [bacterium]